MTIITMKINNVLNPDMAVN